MEAESLSSEDAVIKINLSMTYYKLGNLDKAREKLEEALIADPDLEEESKYLKSLLSD